METTPNGPLTTVMGPPPGIFRWQKLPAWLACCAAIGLLMAWAAAVARDYASPLLLFPLIVGAVLGGMLVLAMRVLDVGHRWTVWLGSLLAGLLTVAGQHYFTFWKVHWEVQRETARDPKTLLKLRLLDRLPPERFWEYMNWNAAVGVKIGRYEMRNGLAWIYWSLDGLLIFVPDLILVGATARLPYCNRCRQWYHTTRSGSLDPHTWAALDPLVKAGLEREIARGRYRLLACQEACGPTGLALSGEGPDGRPCTCTVWLDAARCQQVVHLLDEIARQQIDEETSSTTDDAIVPEQHQGNPEPSPDCITRHGFPPTTNP